MHHLLPNLGFVMVLRKVTLMFAWAERSRPFFLKKQTFMFLQIFFSCASYAYDFVSVSDINKHILLEFPKDSFDMNFHLGKNQEKKYYLHKDAAFALNKVQKKLDSIFLCLKLYDAYQPRRLFQDKLFPKNNSQLQFIQSTFEKGFHYSKGTAVDVTLADYCGRELDIPTTFEVLSNQPHAASSLSKEILKTRSLLKKYMESEGFVQSQTQWWHFFLENSDNDAMYPSCDYSVEEIPFLPNYYLVNRSVVNVYSKTRLSSPAVCQLIYSEPVKVLSYSGEKWVRVRCPDFVEGWVLSETLYKNESYHYLGSYCFTENPVNHVYKEPISKEQDALITLPFRCRLKLLEVLEDRTWSKVELVDGTQGFIKTLDINMNPQRKSLKELMDFSKRFSNCPYSFEGTSSFSYSSVGFVKMLCKEMGISLPRRISSLFKSVYLTHLDKKDLQTGDLLFLGDEKPKVVSFYMEMDEPMGHILDHSEYEPKMLPPLMNKNSYKLLAVRRPVELEFDFDIIELDGQLKERVMRCLKEPFPISMDRLRYVRLKHWGMDQCMHFGEIIVPEDLAYELVRIFEKLYQKYFPIENISLLDKYKGNEQIAHDHNVSTAHLIPTFKQLNGEFYCFVVDINPLLKIIPNSKDNAYFMDKNDATSFCIQIFNQYGWELMKPKNTLGAGHLRFQKRVRKPDCFNIKY